MRSSTVKENKDVCVPEDLVYQIVSSNGAPICFSDLRECGVGPISV